MNPPLGEHSDNLLSSIDAYETRIDRQVRSRVKSYGTYGLGADLTAVAWPKLRHIFTGADADVYQHFARPHCPVLDDVHRTPRAYLHQHPIDLLVLGNLNNADHDAWMKRVPANEEYKPKLVIEFWEPWHITHNDDGPMSKLVVTRWSHLGFKSTCQTANAIQAGGVVDWRWLIVVRRRLEVAYCGP
jgi:hypothetical protein